MVGVVRHTRIVVTHYCGPDALQVIEEECPQPHSGQVRVKVLAAGVSLPDVLAREGIHPETPRVPYTPGWDLVGIVDEIGEGISGFAPGQTVAAMPGEQLACALAGRCRRNAVSDRKSPTESGAPRPGP